MDTWLHTNFKLAPSADCWTTPEGDTICPLPGDPFPAEPVAIPPSWQGYTVGACWPTLVKVDPNIQLSDVPALCGNPVFNTPLPSTLDAALAQMASRDALAPRIPDSFFDGGAPVDFSGLFVAAALLAGVAASGAALLLAKKRRKALAKQEAVA